ncbi:phage major capsid protein [Nostocoides australiense]|nr:phage major capsid protein [Tetrasphaera australiensis]
MLKGSRPARLPFPAPGERVTIPHTHPRSHHGAFIPDHDRRGRIGRRDRAHRRAGPHHPGPPARGRLRLPRRRTPHHRHRRRPLRIPKLGSATTPSWHGENEQIDEVDPTFDEVSLLPSTMKSIKTLTRYSNELARQSVVALDAALKERLVKDVADTMDAQLFSAAGDGIEIPRGLFAYADTQELPVDGVLSLDDLLDAQGLAMAANVDLARTRWVMTSREFIALRKVKDLEERYLIEPDVTAPGRYTLFGVPVLVTNRVPDDVTVPETPTGRAALVDFSQIVVARDVAPSVKILDQTFGDYDQQAIRVVYRLDAKPVNPEAIIVLTGLTVEDDGSI